MDLKVYMKTYILSFSFLCKAGVGVAEMDSTLHQNEQSNFFLFCEIAQAFLV